MIIPHNKPYTSKNTYESVKNVLTSGWINYGDISKKVEKKLSKLVYHKRKNMILTSNGSSGLYLALKALKIKDGDEVIIPSYTCTAVLNAVKLANAIPVICDVSIDNLSFTEDIIKQYITTKTKAIIIVHTFGIPCEIEEIQKFGIPIIEDCSQSLGSFFKDGTHTGSKGDLSVFSFYATKMLTGGIGGAVGSKDVNIMNFLNDYINFDMPKTYKERFNFQISDINSAVILSGLKDLNKILKKKEKIAKAYEKLIYSKYNSIIGINNYRYLLKFGNNKDLKRFKEYLDLKGIKSIIPIENFELLHNYLKINDNNFKNSESLSKTILSIPIYSELKNKEIIYIKRNINDYFSTSTSL